MLVSLTAFAALAVSTSVALPAQPDGSVRQVSQSRTVGGHDSHLRERLLGKWRTQAFGEEVITNTADGKAVMEVKLNRLGALLYGKALTLHLDWSVENGVMKHRITGGAPEHKVAKLIKNYGDRYSYRIVNVDESEVVLEEIGESDKQQRWEAAN